ncbi:hypothetical protein [Mesorhizobium sp.]|uniref:hypothetical protein n=1 Tax=Mesorhizobium sp. TaxID=1871066 RepID=UPI0025FCB153|nr:hypothetical protein [Mesorhizobium sp.]
MRKPEMETAVPSGIGSGGNTKVAALLSYPTFSFSATDFAIATVARRWHLPAPTARVVVELAGLGGQP